MFHPYKKRLNFVVFIERKDNMKSENNKIQIRNCNCIKKADIEIEEHTLNIKYGTNGTGKSTISEAIYAKASANGERLKLLLPYGSSAESSEELPSITNLPFLKIRVFDVKYVNSYLFQGNEFFNDSYQVFLRSDECDNLASQIETLLSELQGIFQSSEEIYNLRKFLPEYFKAVKYNNGTISKRGGVGEFIKGNGGGFENYSELDSYRPFYAGRDLARVSKWAKWRNDGINEMNGDSCPFCTKDMGREIVKQNTVISKVFKNSALATVNAVLEYLRKAVDLNYIKEDAIEALEGYIGNSGKEDAIFAELQQLATETDYLFGKIEKICLFRPMNVTHEQLLNIEANLDNMLIEERQISKFYSTDLVFNMVHHVASKVEYLKQNTSKLKALFLQHESKLEKLIESRKEDINQFFTLAGFPYEFGLKKDGEKKAIAYLVPSSHIEESVKEPNEHLSWGEKNAFSLVMFMFEAISDDADLIVLDDPISSFDENKKFAVVRRLFDNQKPSFRDRTVMMLTHDLQPIIDYVHGRFFIRYGLTTPVKAQLLQNENGEIKEYDITSSDLKNTVELTLTLAKDENNKIHIRVVNLRKYVELVNPNFNDNPLYEVLSNIIHGRNIALDKDENKLDESIFNLGCQELKSYLGELSYDEIIEKVSTNNLIQLIKCQDAYEKVIAIRLLFERKKDLLTKLRRKYPASCKFINETNHVENDYIFQLDPMKFFRIPQCYLQEIEKFIDEEKNRL